MSMRDDEDKRLINEGGFGSVYRVTEKSSKKKFAMKVFKNSKEIPEKELEADWKNEVFRMIQMNDACNYISKYHTSFFDKISKKYVIIMEYYDGGNLSNVIENHFKENTYILEEAIIGYIAEMSMGIECIHRYNVIQHDLKPANILLDHYGHIKIGDFGASSVLHRESQYARDIIGTVNYMSPEMLDEKKHDLSSDIWSLGCICFQLCTLNPPYFVEKNDFAGMKELLQQIRENPFNMEWIPEMYGNDLKMLIASMLVIDTKKRATIKDIIRNVMFDDYVNGFKPDDYRIKFYDKKGTYDGQLKNGKKNGNGVLEFSNGLKYDGCWKDDKRHGHGIQYYGNSKNQEESKFAIMDNQVADYKGDYYDGNWEDDKRNGYGIFYYSNGEKYDGNWKDHKYNGKGTCYYPNGNKYDGEWKDYEYNGKGTYYFAEGGRYDGQWVDSKYDGHGILYFSNGSKYFGEFKNGKKHGKGNMEYPDGTRESGEWRNDNKVSSICIII